MQDWIAAVSSVVPSPRAPFALTLSDWPVPPVGAGVPGVPPFDDSLPSTYRIVAASSGALGSAASKSGPVIVPPAVCSVAANALSRSSGATWRDPATVEATKFIIGPP